MKAAKHRGRESRPMAANILTAEGAGGSTAAVLHEQTHLKEANGCVFEAGESRAAHPHLGIHRHSLEADLDFTSLNAGPARSPRDDVCSLM